LLDRYLVKFRHSNFVGALNFNRVMIISFYSDELLLFQINLVYSSTFTSIIYLGKVKVATCLTYRNLHMYHFLFQHHFLLYWKLI